MPVHVLACTVNTGLACIGTLLGLGYSHLGILQPSWCSGEDLDRPSFVFKPKFKEEGEGKKEEDPCVLFLALSINVALLLFGVPDPLW